MCILIPFLIPFYLALYTHTVVDSWDDVFERVKADQDDLCCNCFPLVHHQPGAEVAPVVDILIEIDVAGD